MRTDGAQAVRVIRQAGEKGAQDSKAIVIASRHVLRGRLLCALVALCAGGAILSFAPASLLAAAPALTLPDNRGYELVSGAGNPGEVYIPNGPGEQVERLEDVPTELPLQASADGNAAAYAGDPGETGGNGRVGIGFGNEFLAVRDPAQRRWDVTDVTPSPLTETSEAPAYQAFSSDLSVGVIGFPSPAFAATTTPPGPPDPGCAVLYSRTASANGTGDFHALFSETQTPGECGGFSAGTGPHEFEDIEFVAGNAGAATIADYRDLLFQSPAALTPGDSPSPGHEGDNLYDSVDGHLSAVNVLPNAEHDSKAVFGGPPAHPGARADFANVISPDGSRIFWTDLTTTPGPENPAGATRLFVRENATSPSARTLQLDAPQQGAEGPGGDGRYWTAAADSSRVLFTDCQRLTTDSTAHFTGNCGQVTTEPDPLPTGNDLYEYDFAKEPGTQLTDLSLDHNGGDPLGADVQGVIGASNDGSYLYFVAGGALAAGAEHRKCREAEPEKEEKREKEELTAEEAERLQAEAADEVAGHLPLGRGCNLYLEHDGDTRLVAVLSRHDDQLAPNPSIVTRSAVGDWQPELGSRTADVTPAGQLVFESTQQLTGYDNSLLGGGDVAVEVFVYQPGGHVICASCSPAGASPTPAGAHEGNGGQTYLPISVSGAYARHVISANGTRVFFDTVQPLVRQDTNSDLDVYEWEREGTEGCPQATSKWGGCVFLLSGGNSGDASYFVDADLSGENVFFTHRGPLGAAGASDDKMNLFDARVNGGFPTTALACTGTGCQGVPSTAPNFATPASITFSATGNFPPPSASKPKRPENRAQKLSKALKVCRRKHDKHKRSACEVTARKRYAPLMRQKSHNRSKPVVKRRTK
jgi:hypothetical protein